jgi:hypothetical protein
MTSLRVEEIPRGDLTRAISMTLTFNFYQSISVEPSFATIFLIVALALIKKFWRK